MIEVAEAIDEVFAPPESTTALNGFDRRSNLHDLEFGCRHRLPQSDLYRREQPREALNAGKWHVGVGSLIIFVYRTTQGLRPHDPGRLALAVEFDVGFVIASDSKCAWALLSTNGTAASIVFSSYLSFAAS